MVTESAARNPGDGFVQEAVAAETLDCLTEIDEDDAIWQEIDMGIRQMKMLEFGYMADLTIKVQDKTFRCHKNIIGISSPKFTTLIRKNPQMLTLKNIEPNHFNILLQIIYGGESVKLDNVEELVAVGRAAYGLQVNAAVALCTKTLRNILNSSSVLQTLEFARVIAKDDLIEMCTKIIQEETDAVLRSDSFVNSNVATLELILCQEKVRAVTELDLFLAFARWVEKNKSPRQEFGSALGLIRFQLFAAKDFAKHVIPTKFLSIEEENCLLLNLVTEEGEMPEGFSNDKNKRHMLFNDIEMQVGTEEYVHLDRTFEHAYLTSEEINARPPLKFSVSADMNLMGVNVWSAREDKTHGDKYMEDVVVTLILANGAEIASAKFRGEVNYFTELVVRFQYPVPINADTTYALLFNNKVSGVRHDTRKRKQKTYKSNKNFEIRLLDNVFSPIRALIIAPKS